MNRRSYLAMVLPLLAGCTSTSPGGSDDGGSPDNGSSDDTGDGLDRLSVGDEAVTDAGISVVVEEVAVGERVEAGYGFHPGDVDRLFVVVRLVAENVGDEPQSLPAPSELRLVADGDQFEPVTFLSGPLTEPVAGDQYGGVDGARTGVGDDGWIVFHLPRDVSSATVSWHDGASATEELRWEIDVADDVAMLPHLEFAGVSMPDTATAGEPVDVEVAVTNRGGSEGSIDLLVWTEDVLDGERELSLTVPAGETVSETITYTVDSPGELLLTVEPFDVSDRLVIEPAE